MLDLDEVLCSFPDSFPDFCKCFFLGGVARKGDMIGVLERLVGGVLGRVCEKVRLSRLNEELLLGGPLTLMALAPRAWKNVMALGHGEQVCAIIS